MDGELAPAVLTEVGDAGNRPDVCALSQCLAVQHREVDGTGVLLHLV